MFKKFLELFDFRVEDDEPVHPADAVYVPGFCLTRDKRRLTALNAASVRAGADLVLAGRARELIIAGCYTPDVSQRELQLRRQIAEDRGINPQNIYEVDGITSTNDEFTKLAGVLTDIFGPVTISLVIVSDEWHLPRAVLAAAQKMPNVRVKHLSVKAPVYEFAWEGGGIVGTIKTLRSGIKPLWILWNDLFYLMARRQAAN